jgi:hypothetical protein
MAEYVSAALFVHTEDTRHLVEHLQNNPSGARIAPVSFEAFRQTPEAHLQGFDHVVVAGSLDVIKETLHFAASHHFSVGILPTARKQARRGSALIFAISLSRSRIALQFN